MAGVICNIIMTIGRGNPGIAHSGAARAGVAELTRSLSYEWGPKVRINCLGPGAIITPGMEATYDDDVLSDIGETPHSATGNARRCRQWRRLLGFTCRPVHHRRDAHGGWRGYRAMVRIKRLKVLISAIEPLRARIGSDYH